MTININPINMDHFCLKKNFKIKLLINFLNLNNKLTLIYGLLHL